MTKRLFYCLLFFLLAIGLSGCLASLEPARTLPEGAYRVHAGVEYFPAKVATTSGTTSSSSISTATRTTLDVGVRFGIDTNVDVGFKLSLPTLSFDLPHLLLDLKYMYAHSGGFTASLGLGTGYLNAKIVSSRSSALDIQGSANFGYDFGRIFGTFLNIRTLTLVPLSNSGSSTLTGGTVGSATLGLRIGDTAGVFAGGTYLRAFKGSSDTFLIGAAFYIGSRSYFGLGAETSGRLERWREHQIEKRTKEPVTAQTSPTIGVSRVVKIRAADKLALLSHPESGRWKAGEKLCVSQGSERLACGIVTKSDKTGAVLKYSGSAAIALGMEATLENQDGVRRRPVDSDPEPSLDPDAGPKGPTETPTGDPEDNSDLNDPVLGLP